ncbi:MAG: amidase, partial [Chloroflexota bacterium]
MTESELCFLTATDMARLVRVRELSPVELVQAHLERIQMLNPDLIAFVHLDEAGAMEAARRSESQPSLAPLHGVPVAYKDIYDVAGMPTTAGSRIQRGEVAERDSDVAASLRSAGAICLGKLNTFEFASGSMELFGDARNPWNLACSPGGSSSGSGTALAARMIPLATGSDTGGSIRIPASFCGLSGLRPTHGLVGLSGIVPLSWSLDSAGPMARTVQDLTLMLDAMLSREPSRRLPAGSADQDSLSDQLDDLPTRVRLGVPRQYFFDDAVDPEVVRAVRGALNHFAGLGAELVEIDLPSAVHGLAASWAIAYTEAFAYHRE